MPSSCGRTPTASSISSKWRLASAGLISRTSSRPQLHQSLARVGTARNRGRETSYQLPAKRYDYAGVILSLARQEHPDTSAYADPEIVIASRSITTRVSSEVPKPQRIQQLLDSYARRFTAISLPRNRSRTNQTIRLSPRAARRFTLTRIPSVFLRAALRPWHALS